STPEGCLGFLNGDNDGLSKIVALAFGLIGSSSNFGGVFGAHQPLASGSFASNRLSGIGTHSPLGRRQLLLGTLDGELGLHLFGMARRTVQRYVEDSPCVCAPVLPA